MYAPPTGPSPSLAQLSSQPRGTKRGHGDGGGGGKRSLGLQCAAPWDDMLHDAVRFFTDALLAACKPFHGQPQRLRYARQFCGANFAGTRDDHMKFIVDATPIALPNGRITYMFAPLVSTSTWSEDVARHWLFSAMASQAPGMDNRATAVSLDAWRKEWQEHRARHVPEEQLEPALATAIAKTLTDDVLAPWLSFFATHFTYKEK